jgi:hypothetical protein
MPAVFSSKAPLEESMAAPMLPPAISDTLGKSQRVLEQIYGDLRSVNERIRVSRRQLAESHMMLKVIRPALVTAASYLSESKTAVP